MNNYPEANRTWVLIEVEVACEIEEAANALLFDLGTAGTVTVDQNDRTLRLHAYFEGNTGAEEVARLVQSRFEGAGFADALIRLSKSEVEDQDWMQKWKEGFEPTLIGGRLLIAPSWCVPEEAGGRTIVRMDPGMAFGTGTHETTRLCLEAIERHWKGGSLLDVGTGTGILAIAAALLAPASEVTAIDVDPTALAIARENAAINGVSRLVEIREAQAADFVGKSFDMVVANLTAEVIIDLAKTFHACTAAYGKVVVSGILSSLVENVGRALNEAGLRIVERDDAGEWSAVVATL